jgi:hypothetical protein
MSRYLKTHFPITLVILLVAAFFTFRGEAQQPKTSKSANGGAVDKPISALAVAFAESDAVRDLPDATASEISEIKGAREINPDNVVPLRKATAAQAAMPSIDATLKKYTSTSTSSSVSPNVPGAPLVNFDGINDFDQAGNTGFLVAPSDENLAVGPHDVVQVVNNGFRIYDKSGNPKTPVKLISKLFTKLGGVCGTFDAGDPIVMHDRMSDRWIISQFDFANPNAAPFFECIAVSKGSDPAGAYYMYAFQTPVETPTTGQNFPDYPHLGVWPDAYYMTVNQFDRANASNFNGTGVYAFNRTKMLVGDPTATFIYFNLNLAIHPEGIGSMQPSDLDGFQLPAAGQPNVFAYAISDELESPPFNVDALRLFNFHADFATPANSTFTERAESPLAMAAYDARSPQQITGTRAEVKQPPPAATPAGTPPAVQGDSLNAISYRVMWRLQYRKLGANENLTGSISVNSSGVTPDTANTYQAGVRYFEIRKTTAAGAYSMFDQATFSPDAGNPATGLNRWLPSAAIDTQGNLAVSYSTSSTSVFPSLAYAGRDFNAAGIPAAGLSAEQTLFAGTGVQLGTGNRWGDYQSLQVDPSDDCTFWTTNQYYNTPAGSTFNWRTRIGSFKFATCTAPAQGTLAGTITSCETGAPISGALVQVSNGFSAGTNPDGTYSIQLPLGNFTVTVSDPSRKCVASSPAAVSLIVSGNTQQFDKCLSGIANPILDTSDPTAVVVSGGNGDGVINPNECNRMKVRLVNAGCATASTLRATLTSSTPGITITAQGNVPYPDLAIDASGFNSVPFQVFAGPAVPSCGTINFTLTTTFTGGTTVNNFTLPVACGTAADQTVNGSLDSTDLKTTNGRLGRADPPSSCAVPKSFPGTLGAGARSYDVISFVQGPGASCITVTPTSATGAPSVILAAAYLGAFNPANQATNYLADQGAILQPFSFIVPANAAFNIVIQEANAGTPNTPYTIKVSGISGPASQGSGPCATTLTTNAQPATTTLGGSISDQATLTTGGSPSGSITFKLFGPNNATCSGTPIFTSVVGVNSDGTYASQSFTPTAAGTYNWIASYSGDANNPAASGACGDANEITTVAAPSPTPTPTATPASQTLNLSTRMRTDTGNNVGIGGFTITGAVPKHVLIRAVGPSLTKFGFTTAEVLTDPTLEVHGPGAFGTITNNNWRDSQEAQIKADGLAPTNDLESAIDATLPPGAYTAILAGNTGTPPAGICLFEVYDLDTAATSKLANLSTRAFVGTGNNVVIAGFVLGNNQGNDRVVVRGLGPSLSSFGIANTLADPTLELRNENGVLLVADNDWQDDPAQAAEITADGLAPSDSKESAIAATLPPGLYTAILSGLNGGTGVGTVEVYDLGP